VEGEEMRRPGAPPRLRARMVTTEGLLAELLLGRGLLVILGGLAVGAGDAKGLLQEFAGLQAVAAGVAPGLDADLAGRRHQDLDHSSVHEPSRFVTCRSRRCPKRWIFPTEWNALRKRLIQRAGALRFRPQVQAGEVTLTSFVACRRVRRPADRA